jgi:hypothetical protein
MPPSSQLKTDTDPVSETSVVSVHIEFQMMDKVDSPSKSDTMLFQLALFKCFK